ncbi:uncharacterized protein LOC144101663 [Amblyomma americanum]
MQLWGREDAPGVEKIFSLGLNISACILIIILAGVQASQKAHDPVKKDCRYHQMLNHTVRALHRVKLEDVFFEIQNPNDTSEPPYTFNLTKGRLTIRCRHELLGYSKCCGFHCGSHNGSDYCFLPIGGSYATYVGYACSPSGSQQGFSVVIFLLEAFEEEYSTGFFVIWEKNGNTSE